MDQQRSLARLQGFSDAMLAVIITIMALELRPPPSANLAALQTLIPGLLIYVLSFTVIGIYWNNHHHLLHGTRHISGGVMWANLHLLFWLSLVPVVTAWVGAHPRDLWPAVIYGAIGFMTGIACYTLMILMRAILKVNKDTTINELLQRDTKAKVSVALIALGMALAFLEPLLAYAANALVSIMWFIPDRQLATNSNEQKG